MKVTYRDDEETITKEIEYTYDVFDRRIKKSIDADGAGEGAASAVEYTYDGNEIALAYDGTGSLTNRYLHGPEVDQILADEQFSPSTPAEMPEAIGDLFWMLTDNLGSVRDVVDSDGSSVADHPVYDGFGKVTSETDDSFKEAFGYTGRERDTESGLTYNRARYTDPGTGGFLNPDPSGFEAGDANLYRYVGNGPTNATDPTGLEPFTVLNTLSALTGPAPHARVGAEVNKLRDKYNAGSKEDLRYGFLPNEETSNELTFLSDLAREINDAQLALGLAYGPGRETLEADIAKLKEMYNARVATADKRIEDARARGASARAAEEYRNRVGDMTPPPNTPEYQDYIDYLITRQEGVWGRWANPNYSGYRQLDQVVHTFAGGRVLARHVNIPLVTARAAATYGSLNGGRPSYVIGQTRYFGDVPRNNGSFYNDYLPGLKGRGQLYPGSATGTFRTLLTPEEQARFTDLVAQYPQWMPAQGLDTLATVRTVSDNAAARAEFTGRGHHPHPLKFGGQPNPPDLVPTGETRTDKNPVHTEITNYWNGVLRRINSDSPSP